MAKIGTAHIELKPVLDEAALQQITDRIEEAVRKGIEAGMAAASRALVAPAPNTGGTWNGVICATCGTRYLGSHTCTSAAR